MGFQREIGEILEHFKLLDPRTIELPPVYGDLGTVSVDIQAPDAHSLLSELIYNKFHARTREVVADTTKVDIVRFLRSHSMFQKAQSGAGYEKPFPRLSFDRSPGFAHVFGRQGWSDQITGVGRVYITAPGAVARTNLFIKVLESFESFAYPLQAKMSWNPSALRSDDIVLYFDASHGFSEGCDLASFVLNEVVDPHFRGAKSVFTKTLTSCASIATEVRTPRNEGMSFGIERSAICADLVLAILRGKGDEIQSIAEGWGIDLSALFPGVN
ncbi:MULTISPECIES: T3SS effector HopA1 family protein [Corynebacterium]|uniref:Uncharacterized protein n=1 Tax=Corynebacterium timonense TaxID=441500 RepID=A0A1H1UDW8_9CORY|nr:MULTISPECIES: T3SS effector HopA1 family protein [Corynebacterium]WJY69151.1 hypothetical protein CAURIS_11425 [Corynebacterium auris]SDS70704.1 hypothetical protein SAMN04488539_2219 [Corynebacterium timonense]